MNHRLILFFYGTIVLNSLIMSSIFIGYHSAKETDFTTKEGNLKETLILTKDEYGEDVRLKF